MTRLASSTGTLRKLGFSVSRVVDADKWGEFAEEELIEPSQGRSIFRSRFARRPCKLSTQAGVGDWDGDTGTSSNDAVHNGLLESSRRACTIRSNAEAGTSGLVEASLRSGCSGLTTSQFATRLPMTASTSVSSHPERVALCCYYFILRLIIQMTVRSSSISRKRTSTPKSVFDELVSLFIAAKSKRQVIMVTHNANLVINTDADQIIIANAGPHPSGGLPSITYVAGGLEEAHIRKGCMRHPRRW